jgi:hypothetical protein
LSRIIPLSRSGFSVLVPPWRFANSAGVAHLRCLAATLMLATALSGQPAPCFADSGGTGARALAVRNAHGWAAMSGSAT